MIRRPVASWLSPQVQDVLLAVFVTAVQIQGTTQAAANSEVIARPLSDLGHLGYVLLTVSGLSLIVRRRWPVAVFALTGVVSLLYFSVGYSDGPGWIALFIAMYTVTAHGDGRRSIRIAGVGIVILAAGWLMEGADVEPQAAIGWVFFRIGALVMAAALGESSRSRRVIAADAVERAERAERTREEEARQRVDAERLRIAREVHDTVAHAIAIINVQSGVTAHVLNKRPEQAGETLVTIEQTSAQALSEMRAILGVLRGVEDGREPAPPGLGRLGELTTIAREAGLDVTVEAESSASEAVLEALPSAVDIAAYRIVQEAITNVIRHAGPTQVVIAIGYEKNLLDIRVTDDGSIVGPVGASSDTTNGDASPGRGIIGMRERCELLGGELAAGPLPRGGFEVHARLPLSLAEAVSG